MWLLAEFSSSGTAELEAALCSAWAMWASPEWQLANQKSIGQEDSREGVLAGVTLFCNLIMEVTIHQLCHILLVKSKSLRPGHIRSIRVKYQEMSDLGWDLIPD